MCEGRERGEKTYDASKAILDAVAVGALPAQVVADIKDGKATIHGVAKELKLRTEDKPARKAKTSRWQTLVRGFTTAVRRIVSRGPQRRAEIAAAYQRIRVG